MIIQFKTVNAYVAYGPVNPTRDDIGIGSEMTRGDELTVEQLEHLLSSSGVPTQCHNLNGVGLRDQRVCIECRGERGTFL